MSLPLTLALHLALGLSQAQTLVQEAPSPISVSFAKIVDTSASIPGTAIRFTGFRSAAIDGRVVAFHGGHFLGPEGIHRWEGGVLTTVVDSLTPIPGYGPNDTFVGVSDPSLSQGHVSFTGARDVPGLSFEGCLTDIGGLTIVAERGDPVPGIPGLSFLYFFTSSLSNGDVAFTSLVGGISGTRVGVYSTVGGLHTVVDTTTAIPGGGTFSGFHFNGTFSGGNSTFCGGATSPDSGVYSDIGSLHVIADTGTPIPGGSGNFTSFSDSPVIRGKTIAFRAFGSGGQRGIYTNIGGLSMLADTSTPIPRGNGTFTGFNDFSYHGPPVQEHGRVAFLGQGSAGQAGIYAGRSGQLHKVIDLTDPLDGKSLQSLDLGREGFDGNHISFAAYFTDGSAGVFVATLH